MRPAELHIRSSRTQGRVARHALSGALGLVVGVAVALTAAGVAWAPPNPTIDCSGGGAQCNGTAANDHIHGTNGYDEIQAREGSDIAEARDTGDIVAAGANDDIAQGEVGFDWVDGFAGFDSFNFGGSLVGLHGNRGEDLIGGGDGVDTLSGGEDPDRLRGGNDHDHCGGGGGNDQFESCHIHGPGDTRILSNAF